MEQFIWLFVLLIIWIVPAILRANAKKKKAAEMQARKTGASNQVQTQNLQQRQHKQQSSSQEVEKMLEKLLGVEVTHEEESPITIAENENTDAFDIEEVPTGSEYDLERAEKLSFEELIALGESDSGFYGKNNREVEKSVHPDISDFDLRKAVIYSEILKPKYF